MILEKRGSKASILGGWGSMASVAALAACLGFFPNAAAGQSSPQRAVARKSAGAPTGQQTFPSAVEATTALVNAVQADDQPALLKILGPTAQGMLSSGDDTEDKNDRDDFTQKYQQMHRLVNEPDGTTTLYIGAENWPTPIPLVHAGSVWYFDTAAGKKEVLYRRIGKNELSVIQTCRELVDAEKEYYAQPHDGDAQKQYAQKFFSDPDKHDGLYWKADTGAGQSPIGPLVAAAASQGYTKTNEPSQPFEGYYFRILKGQGASAAGGARSYLTGGKMTRGFAIVAYPAEYRSSGVKTFLVDQAGIVYEKDLGKGTTAATKAMMNYDRDATWRKAD